jgi:hypothetical protein
MSMATLDGVWKVRRTGGALPPLVGVRKEIEWKQGVTRLGLLPGIPFDVDGLRLCYRGFLSAFVDELVPVREGYHGRATFRGRELGRFAMTRMEGRSL